MFGNPKPPQPPKYEPVLLILLAVLIAGVLTLLAYGVLVFGQRLEQAG